MVSVAPDIVCHDSYLSRVLAVLDNLIFESRNN